MQVVGKGEIDLTQRKLSEVGPSKYKKRKAGGARTKVARLSVGVSQEDYTEAAAVANIGEKQDSPGTSGTIIRNDGNPDEIVKAKRATRSKGLSSRVQSDLNISKEVDEKQGTKRKRSSTKSSPAHTIAGSNELSLATEILGKGDQDRAQGSSNTHPEIKSPTEKPSPKKRGRKSNASSSLKDLSGKTQKKTSEKRLKLDSPLISSKATLTDELNQVVDKEDATNKKKSTVDKGNHTMQGLEKCSTINKSSSGGSAHLRRRDGPSTMKFTCAFCQSSEDTEVGFTISHWSPRCRPLLIFTIFLIRMLYEQASGEMAHYHRGEPVSADFNGGSKVLHVHKNCAEW